MALSNRAGEIDHADTITRQSTHRGPGRIATDQVPSERYAAIWSHLATQCTADGGWDAEQWLRLEESLPALFAA